MTIVSHVVRVELDASGSAIAASATTTFSDGTYRTQPLDCEPFGTPADAFVEAYRLLDIQLSFW